MMGEFYVHSGYAAINIGTLDEPKWIGVLQGNIFCDKIRRFAKIALKDAKKKYKLMFLSEEEKQLL